MPPPETTVRKVRQFNKRFYEEFRREAQKQDKSKAKSTRSSGAVPETSKHQVTGPMTRGLKGRKEKFPCYLL